MGSALGLECVRDVKRVQYSTSVRPQEASFDMVVGADGIHSRIREIIWGPVAERDPGWGCLAWSADRGLAAVGETTERWGVGSYLGLSSCRDRLEALLLAHQSPFCSLTIRFGRTDRARGPADWPDVPADGLPAGFPSNDEPLFFWRMGDVRVPTWGQGRVVLVGDATAAFLPTAGIGASIALESSAVLADELSCTDAAHFRTLSTCILNVCVGAWKRHRINRAGRDD